MILIRKECQEILDAVDLGQFHIESTSNRSKYYPDSLQLTTECGKPLLSIKGIPVKSTRYSKAEREYTVSLFDAFLTKYLSEIKEYVALMKVAKLHETREERLEALGYKGLHKWWFEPNKLYALGYIDGPFYLQVIEGVKHPNVQVCTVDVENTTKTKPEQSFRNLIAFQELQAHVLDQKKFKQALLDVKVFAKEVRMHEEGEERLTELREIFETCSI